MYTVHTKVGVIGPKQVFSHVYRGAIKAIMLKIVSIGCVAQFTNVVLRHVPCLRLLLNWSES